MSGEGKGCCMNLIIGIIGSYVGTFISHLLNIELLGKGYLTNFGRFGTHHRLLRCWCCYRVVALEETVLIEHDLRMSFIKYIADENHYKEVLSTLGEPDFPHFIKV
jgi:hypothetical protein